MQKSRLTDDGKQLTARTDVKLPSIATPRRIPKSCEVHACTTTHTPGRAVHALFLPQRVRFGSITCTGTRAFAVELLPNWPYSL